MGRHAQIEIIPIVKGQRDLFQRLPSNLKLRFNDFSHLSKRKKMNGFQGLYDHIPQKVDFFRKEISPKMRTGTSANPYIPCFRTDTIYVRAHLMMKPVYVHLTGHRGPQWERPSHVQMPHALGPARCSRPHSDPRVLHSHNPDTQTCAMWPGCSCLHVRTDYRSGWCMLPPHR